MLLPNEVVNMGRERRHPDTGKLTQAQVPEQIDISQPACAQQKDARMPRPATLKRIVTALSETVEQLSEE